MNVQHKDATITNTDDTFPGSFEVILSTKAKDRDGDELATEDWKQPLPDHITFDADHGMSVATTVGSGRPYIDDQGRMVVEGTYSSLPRAQEVRTLVNEGHIRTTSVAFMSEKSTTKDGKSRTVRELLNGAFVAIPSNREALVLSSKGAIPTPSEVFGKAGARNSKSDAEHIQAIHDHAVALGAVPADSSGAAIGATGGKSGANALEEALALLKDVDVTDLSGHTQKAIALLTAVDEISDESKDVEDVPDPDADGSASEAPAEEKAADSSDVDLKYQALMIEIATAIPE